MHAYAYKVQHSDLPQFLGVVNKHDDLGGNNVEFVKDCRDYVLVAISRRCDYLYITARLQALAEGKEQYPLS
jgi:hypothetical protein